MLKNMIARRRRRGNAALFAAFMLVPLSLLAGIGIDFGRTASAAARLSQAVDGAALAGGRVLSAGNAQAEAQEYFKANFDAAAENVQVEPLIITKGDHDRTLTVSVAARIGTTFLQLAGATWETLPIAASATARRTTLGMELAMVLDVTGSMAGASMTALRAASTDLINIVYGPQSTIDNLFVAIVPYVAAVNFGTNRTAWLTGGTVDQSRYAPHRWRGCVEARSGGEDETDTPPAIKPFAPFFAPSGLPENDNIYGSDKPPTDQSSVDPKNSYTRDNYDTGPNLSCGQPMTGLSTNRDQLLAIVAALQPSAGGGTMAPLGLQAGWMTLSPKWRGLWGTNTWGTTTPAGLPLDYATPFMQKVIVMMTDGNNTWHQNDSNAYGQPRDGRLGPGITSNAAATPEINRRMTRMCTRIKATGIVIYTVTLGPLSADTQKLYRDCASAPNFYFAAPSPSQLRTAFQEIGSQLGNLRLEK